MGIQIPHGKGQKGHPVVKYRDTLWLSIQKRLKWSRCHLRWELRWAQGTMYILHGGPDPHGKGQFWGEEKRIVSIGTFCREPCKNGWSCQFAIWIVDSGRPKEAQFAKWRQCAHMGRHIDATWRIRLSRLWRRCGQTYVKLLWPLVRCYRSVLLIKP